MYKFLDLKRPTPNFWRVKFSFFYQKLNNTPLFIKKLNN